MQHCPSVCLYVDRIVVVQVCDVSHAVLSCLKTTVSAIVCSL